MPKVFTSKRQKIGELGETIACIYLKKQGFSIIEQNYTKPWGEIDIVAVKDQKVYFIEVKAVSRERKGSNTVRYGMDDDFYRPEENMSRLKLRKLYRTIEIYIKDKKISIDTEWQLDLICVYLNNQKRIGEVKRIENIV